MTAPPESADEINQAAALWAARADRGLTAAEQTELDAWLARGRQRAGAYMRMTAVLASTEVEDRSAGESLRGNRWTARGANRRRLLAAGGGALAASLIGGAVYLGVDRPARHVTRKGEKRVVALDDGSTVTLNTATRLDVRFSSDERLIQLVEGEALFDVASDPARPFIVRAGDADVRAVGTSFTVARIEGRPVQVLVREGVVEVDRPRAGRPEPMRIAANTRAVVSSKAVPVVVTGVEPSEVSRELAWREGRLVFTDESLSSAVAQFARYSDTRIVVSDPVLARSGVAGVFDANDPVGFARSVALSLDARTEVQEGQVLIRR